MSRESLKILIIYKIRRKKNGLNSVRNSFLVRNSYKKIQFLIFSQEKME